MKNNYLDKKIKHILENLEVAFTPEAWQLMEQRIMQDPELSDNHEKTKPATEDVDIDALTKAVLGNLNVPYTPSDWDKMQARLDEEDLLNPESTRTPTPTLEDQIASTLGSLEVPYDASSWDMMEAQLDLKDNLDALNLDEDDPIDHIIYDNLSNLSPRYDEKSWEKLSERLDEEFSFRKRVLYRYKVAEIGLMLLLIFTIFNLYPVYKNYFVDRVKQEISPQPSSQPNQKQTYNCKSPNTDEILAASDHIVIPFTAAITEELAQEVIIPPISTIVTNANARPQPYNAYTPIIENKNNAPPHIEHLPFEEIRQLDWSDTYIKALSTRDRITDDIVALPILGLGYLPTAENKLGDYIVNRLIKLMELKASLFILGEHNFIMTPHDPDFDLDAYTHTSLGYGMGFTFGFVLNRWEIETGGIYASNHYETRNSEIIGDFENGYVDNALKLELELLKIPLNIRYNFDQLPNWNFYASTGASLNIAMIFTDYFDATYQSTPSNYRDIQSRIQEKSLYNNKTFSEGFLEGGDFITNRFFTANLGLGIERKVTSKWSVFLQKNYQHTLPFNGLGPNKDRYNTISIFAGVRATLR